MTAVVAGPDIDAVSVNTIRTLCIDAVQAANSGHPGTPMAMAPVVYTLWQNVLRFDPAEPGSVRPVGGACLDAALLDPASDQRAGRRRGLRDGGRTGSGTRRP